MDTLHPDYTVSVYIEGFIFHTSVIILCMNFGPSKGSGILDPTERATVKNIVAINTL